MKPLSDHAALGMMVPADLLAELERRFPDRCGDPRASHTDFIIAAAQRDVVNLLKTAREAAIKASTTSPLLGRPAK